MQKTHKSFANKSYPNRFFLGISTFTPKRQVDDKRTTR
jgi:hypothetical protein